MISRRDCAHILTQHFAFFPCQTCIQHMDAHMKTLDKADIASLSCKQVWKCCDISSVFLMASGNVFEKLACAEHFMPQWTQLCHLLSALVHRHANLPPGRAKINNRQILPETSSPSLVWMRMIKGSGNRYPWNLSSNVLLTHSSSNTQHSLSVSTKCFWCVCVLYLFLDSLI